MRRIDLLAPDLKDIWKGWLVASVAFLFCIVLGWIFGADFIVWRPVFLNYVLPALGMVGLSAGGYALTMRRAQQAKRSDG